MLCAVQRKYWQSKCVSVSVCVYVYVCLNVCLFISVQTHEEKRAVEASHPAREECGSVGLCLVTANIELQEAH
jgi:hypothetical protein